MPSCDPAEARRRFAEARVAALATLDPSGRPHQVPVTFVVAAGSVWTAIDEKPKGLTTLRRLTNIRSDPRVSLLVQHWDEDWSRLWWVRADGAATVDDSQASLQQVAGLLRRKYPQYGDVGITGPVVEVSVGTWRGWAAVLP
jgi:PPOX class probable F420-dependent enzyme